MKILFLGDIVGKPARAFLKELLPRERARLGLDVVVVNGENAAGGSSITKDTALEIFSSGVDIITTGDHIFKKQESKEVLESMAVIRPLNYGPSAWGKGFILKEIKDKKIAVINLVGRVFMPPMDCPFRAVNEILEAVRKETPIIVVDIHAEATSEKLALGYYLAGKVSAVIGTHTHIPTADERIIDAWTAYITDAGMTGSFDSVLGRDKLQIIERFVTNMPVRFNLSQGDVRAQGVVIVIDDASGRALSIERIEYKKDVPVQ